MSDQPGLLAALLLLHGGRFMVDQWIATSGWRSAHDDASLQWIAAAKLRALSSGWRGAVDAWYSSTRECRTGPVAGTRNARVTDDVVRHISSCCPSLECLDIAGAAFITDAALTAVAICCPRLRTLSLQRSGANGAFFSDVGLRAISRVTQLTALDLGGLGAASFDLLAIKEFALSRRATLVRLNLTGASWLTDEGVCALGNTCIYLESLMLSGCSGIRDTGLSCIAANCVGLHEIDLSNCRRVTERGVSALARLERLAHLELSNCSGATDESAIALALRGSRGGCASLRHLGLRKCTALSEAGVCRLAESCASLTRLDVSECRLAVTDAVLEAIGAHCSSLRAVDLSGSDECTEAGLMALVRGCPQLESFAADGCDSISDSVASAMSSLLPGLRILRTAGCENISRSALLELSRANPMLAIGLGPE